MNKIRKYIDKLNYYTKCYDEGKPEISDKEWDDLYFELEKIEKETGIIYPDSPTQIIYWNKVSELKKVEHDHPMLSLAKTKNIEDVKTFINNQPFVGMFKMDGLTCSLTYDEGVLIKAETRGDGHIGEDIYFNALVIKNIPLTIPYKKRLVVDGEIICRLDDFKPFEKEYKNPRNFAAGSIRLLSSEECQKRNLSFIAWDVINGYESPYNLYDNLLKLKDYGFTIVPCVLYDNFDGDPRKKLDNIKDFDIDGHFYPIDGYVFKFNDLEYSAFCGQTAHHFKDAIAYKFYDDLYDTRLKYIDWTMGRTGVLSPVAVFDPIDIDGTTVERASLHNVSIMRETLGNCAYVGEPLKIYKANQIIPQIAEAGPKYDYGYVIANGGVSANDVIERCPICHNEVEYKTSEEGVINVYCTNPNCEGKLVNRLDHYCGKKGLDINGLSKATLEKFVNWGWIENISDLYNLSSKRILLQQKIGFGDKSITKILKAIEDSKNTTLDKFISAMGIPLIGQTVSKKLAKEFKTYNAFRDAVMDDSYYFFDLPNFGIEMNNSLKNFDYTEMDKISNILSIQPFEDNSNDILKGQTFVITGKLSLFKNRDELKKKIEENGGKVTGSISNKTTILINNDINSSSAKNKAAKEKNIPILTEEEFLKKFNFDN